MVVCILDGLNLNDGLLYFVQLGFDPGEEELTYDEFPSYAGGLAIRNVSRAHVAQATLPVDVRAASEAAMKAGVAADQRQDRRLHLRYAQGARLRHRQLQHHRQQAGAPRP